MPQKKAAGDKHTRKADDKKRDKTHEQEKAQRKSDEKLAERAHEKSRDTPIAPNDISAPNDVAERSTTQNPKAERQKDAKHRGGDKKGHGERRKGWLNRLFGGRSAPKGNANSNPFYTWKRLKDMRLGSRSKKVFLLQNPRNRRERIVMKQYDASDKHHRGRYEKELLVLTRLKGCEYAPQLLHSDDSTCSLWMTYCGRVAPLNAKTKAAVEHILRELADKWGVHRVSNGGTVNRLDAQSIFPKNITELDGVIRAIDYGSASWQLSPKPQSNPAQPPASAA